ncbi:MAG: hypothetical protein WBF95_16505 [Comamonas thiooxydans]
MNNEQMPMDYQAATALSALAAALCKQPGIDGQKLRMDFLDALEGIAQTPGNVGMVGRTIASLMDTTLRAADSRTD